jgi:hypothetical protein
LHDEDNQLYAARKLRNTLHKTLQEIEEEIQQLQAKKRRKNRHPHYVAMHIHPKGTNGVAVPHVAGRGKAVHE